MFHLNVASRYWWFGERTRLAAGCGATFQVAIFGNASEMPDTAADSCAGSAALPKNSHYATAPHAIWEERWRNFPSCDVEECKLETCAT